MRLFFLLFISTVIVACAGLPTQREQFYPQHADEQIDEVRSGRFVLRLTEAGTESLGTQGQFELMRLSSMTKPRASRRVLIWLGPLGQSLGSLEQRPDLPVRIFDAQGLLLSEGDKRRFAQRLLGLQSSESVNDAALDRLLDALLELITRATKTDEEHQLAVGSAQLHLRIALDPVK